MFLQSVIGWCDMAVQNMKRMMGRKRRIARRMLVDEKILSRRRLMCDYEAELENLISSDRSPAELLVA